MSKQKRLGRGLDALLASRQQPAAPSAVPSAEAQVPTIDIPVDELRPGRYQPRQLLSDEGLAELADSIREQGILQPLVVRACAAPGGAAAERKEACYEIVAGERRWRAARLAGLSAVPAIVRELDDQSALAVALIENLQREDLNPVDQARSLARLAEEFELTHEQVAKAVGRSRASVSNLLRLLGLHEDVKALLAAGDIDMGHARALLPLDAEGQCTIAGKAKSHGWSVRKVESAVRNLLAAPPDDTAAGSAVDLQTRWLQQQIGRELGQAIRIRPARDGRFSLQVSFADLPQLQDALQRIQELVGQVRATAGPRVRDASS